MSAEEKKKARAKIVAAAKEHGIEVSDEADKAAIARACAKISLKKGMYEVSWLADIVEGLNWLCLQTEFERDLEDDGSKVPDGLREAWLALLAEFKAMAIEEADELAAGAAKGATSMKITDQAGLTKAAKTLQEHVAKVAEHHEKIVAHQAKQMEHHEKGLELHKAHVELHKAHKELIEKCMKAAKDAMDGQEPEGESEEEKARKAAAAAAASDPVAKAVAALTAEIEALKAKLATTPAPQNIPGTGIALAPAVKSMSADAAFGELIAVK
jgi:lambda repressor-like predicted transcriptional regulator